MKDEILNYVTMENILDKYGIEHKRGMFSCPFHGEDRKPSAKAYYNSFYCFSCNATGDIIEFVEELFNLSFKEAMQKINIDFGLGLENNKVDYEKLRQVQNIKNEKKIKKKKLTKRYCDLCDNRLKLEKAINILNKKINVNNWETMVSLISNYDIRLQQIELKLEEIDNKLSSRT